MRILAIETSCDDTAVAILEVKGKKILRFQILSNIVSSQVKLHQKYGGVYPFLAKREHQRNLPIVLNKALRYAQGKRHSFDLIAVTNGPGLEPCLWVGVNFAKELAEKLKIPLMPVNHIEAHILANLLPQIRSNFQFSIFNFQSVLPAICLIVSGGHTQLILMRNFSNYKILGETRDDAAGECFDKTARILGLGYPGGPAIAAEAAKYKIPRSNPFGMQRGRQDKKYKIQLPRPMIYQKNYDFSFSGLKTAVLYLVKELTKDGKKLTIVQKREISAEIQQAVIDVLIHKTLKAAKDYRANSIILGGGVTANEELRKQFSQNIKKEIPYSKFYIPDSRYCTDNAAMVAVTAYFRITHKESPNQSKFGRGQARIKNLCLEKITADANLRLSFKN